eukprot:403368817
MESNLKQQDQAKTKQTCEFVNKELKFDIQPDFDEAKRLFKAYFYQQALQHLESLISIQSQQTESGDLSSILDQLKVQKLYIKTLVNITNFFKAKIIVQEFSDKLNLLKAISENDQHYDLRILVKCYESFIAVSYEKSGYYNIAFPLLNQISDENMESLNSLTQKNLLKSFTHKHEEKLFKYQLKVQLSLSKLHAYYFEYKTADRILSELETNLVNRSLEDIVENLKPQVFKVQVKVLNQRAKYYMSLQLYDKTKDVLFKIVELQDVLEIDVFLKLRYQTTKVNTDTYDNSFVSLKIIMKKFLTINQHHIFNLQLVYNKDDEDTHTDLLAKCKRQIEMLDPTGKELFISLMFANHSQFFKHSKLDSDSDQVSETFKFLRDMCKQQSDQLGDNNKFMDMIFNWNQLLIQSILLSPIQFLRIVDEVLIYLNEIAMPFYLSHIRLNKMSLYKIFNALYFIITQAHQLQNKLAIGLIEKNYFELLKNVKSIERVSDGTIDFFELCERIQPMLYFMFDIQEFKDINLRDSVRYIHNFQKIIADELFHGEYYNYQGKLLQHEKIHILTMKNINCFYEECVMEANKFLAEFAKNQGLKMVIRISKSHDILAHVISNKAISYRKMNKLNNAFEQIQKAIQKIEIIEKNSQPLDDSVIKIKLTYYLIMLDCGKLQINEVSKILREIQKFKDNQFYMSDPLNKEYYQELKEKLEQLEKTHQRKQLQQALGVGLLASSIAIGTAFILAKQNSN